MSDWDDVWTAYDLAVQARTDARMLLHARAENLESTRQAYNVCCANNLSYARSRAAYERAQEDWFQASKQYETVEKAVEAARLVVRDFCIWGRL